MLLAGPPCCLLLRVQAQEQLELELELELELALALELALLELPGAVAQTGLAVQGPEHSLLR